jgi:hypothetical protein
VEDWLVAGPSAKRGSKSTDPDPDSDPDLDTDTDLDADVESTDPTNPAQAQRSKRCRA